jgi:hypothetical protein
MVQGIISAEKQQRVFDLLFLSLVASPLETET